MLDRAAPARVSLFGALVLRRYLIAPATRNGSYQIPVRHHLGYLDHVRVVVISVEMMRPLSGPGSRTS